jgi:hypothetical protein
LGLIALSFLAGGLGLLFNQEWWRLMTIGAAALSVLATSFSGMGNFVNYR